LPYVPTFGGNNLGIGPAASALIPASMMSAAVGMACLGGWALLALPPLAPDGPEDIIAALVFGSFALGVGAIAATFIVTFYLCIFGLPIAVLLGDRIRHPLALAISMVDALAGAIFATTGSKLGMFGGDDPSPEAFALVLCFALPAGYLYRRNIIALREQAEFA